MKQTLILLLILIFTSCQIIPCEKYYLYSEIQAQEQMRDVNYKPKYVNDSLYTTVTDSRAAFTVFKDIWPDGRIVKIGCPDTLKLKE